MKNLLSALLTVALLLFVTFQTFSQGAEGGDNASKLFNEGGYVRGITPARVIGIIELVLAVGGLVMAWRAKKTLSAKTAKLSLWLGACAILSSVIHFLITSGAVFGSGSGKAGAIIAGLIALIGILTAQSALRKINAATR